MRPREIINKRKNLYLIMVALGFAAMTVLAFSEKYMSPANFKPALYSAIALFAAGNILLYVGIRCPKCKSIIGSTIVFSAGKADHCPRCGVMFDEEMPGY
jgi:hypothetical protein